MSVVVRLRTRPEIDQEAATWIWRLDAGHLAADQEQAYDAWLRQDPRHRRAIGELSRLWGELDQLGESRFTDRHRLEESELSRPVMRSHRHLWWVAAAAILSVAVIGGTWLRW